MAAVLAGGDGAVLSHCDAGAVWGILSSHRSRIEVTVGRKGRARPGIQFHCVRLPADEMTVVRGIPVTTVPRTVFDLAARQSRRRTERAIHEVEVRRLWDPLSLHDLIARHPGARGTVTLRATLADHAIGSTVTKEELEERVLAFLEQRGLPRPALNRPLWLVDRWITPDCTWEEQMVIVELDGYAVHATRRNYEGDRSRDRALQAARWDVVRITWRQLLHEGDAVAADLRALLR